MKKLTLYRCELCGNLVCMVEDTGVVPVCCGAEMTLLTANTREAAAEKHIPVISVRGTDVRVTVGEAIHPMLEGHHIEWIAVLTDRGTYSRRLEVGGAPSAEFTLREGEEVLAGYAMCNLHGLWKKEMT